MIDERLWRRAQRLAARPYAISFDVDTLTSGECVIILRHPELPPVKAQGFDMTEAKQAVDDARTDYIYSLLEDGKPVPAPVASSKTRASGHGQVWKLDGNAQASIENVTTLSLAGDFAKHG